MSVTIEGVSYQKIAQLYNVGKTNIYYLVRCYKKHGIEAITCQGNWRNFTESFKLEIINRNYMGESITFLAIECNVTLLFQNQIRLAKITKEKL